MKEDKVKSINPGKKFTLDFDKPLRNLDGTADEANTIGKFVAQYLGSNTDGDSYKFSSWAMLAFQGKPIEVDEADFKMMKEYLKTGIKIAAMLRRQVLDIMDEAEI